MTQVIQALQETFPDLAFERVPLCVYASGRDSGQYEIHLPPERLLEVMQFLRDDPRTCFEQLADLTCVDYLNYPGARHRFGVVYCLLSHRHHQRLWVKVFLDDPDPELPSVTSIWQGAEWPEREVYDMFGVRFRGHPDLRRILMPANFEDYPLRKDYPLHGKGEREAFEVIRRDSA